VSVVDMMVPLGRGQRQLIIGDRKTGKTEFLIQSILTQARQGTICIYAGVGRKLSDIEQVEKALKKAGVMHRCMIITAPASDSLANIYISPFSAMTYAEFFKDSGYDVLVILDDLTTHATTYREISLLARKFPGRNSYPADVFYLHSRLLERAGNYDLPEGERSITCLPVSNTWRVIFRATSRQI